MKILTDTLDKDVQFLRNEKKKNPRKTNKQAKTQTKNKSI